jgi:hypothetical protein
MTTVTLRQQKLSPLTNQEIDDNFSNLNTNKLESVVYPNLTTSGSGWYRVATTNTDGRGTYDLEVYTTGGNHDPSVLKIVAQCNWTGGRVLYAIWDGVFPASSVRVTRSASNSYLEIYFTTSVNTFAVRVNHTGFASGIVGYSGALSSGGDTVAETLALTSRFNISSGYLTSESDTLATVTGRGATANTSIAINSTVDGLLTLNKSSGTTWGYINFSYGGTRKFYFGINASNEPELGTDNSSIFRVLGGMTIAGNTAYHAGNLTNLNQLINGPGYITGYTETDTLATVTGRGASTSTAITINNTLTSSSTIQASNGRIALRDDSVENWATDNDSAGVAVNYFGYASGTTRFRNFNVYDGKGNIRLNVYGQSNYTEASGSLRAPIFYDSNDPSYYLDPNNTGTSGVFAGQLVLADGIRTATSGFSSPYNLFALSDTYDGATYYGIKYVEGSPDTIQIIGANNVGLSIGMDVGDTIASSSLRAPIFYDSTDPSYYLDPDSSGTSLQIAGTIEQGNNYAHPNIEWSASGTSTGEVIFYLPGTTSNYGMVHMVFDIYEYNSPRLCTVIVGGHNWSTSWYNTGCNVIGYTDKQVRLGVKDGRFVVVFGTTGSSWSYGQIRLRKIQNGLYYNNSMNLGGNWSATQTTTESFTSITGDLRGFRTPAQLEVDGNLYAYTDVRSPIYYDYNDTGYYLNPRESSRLSGLRLDGVDNQASGEDAILWINKPNNNDWALIISGALEYGIDARMAASHSYAYRALANGSEYYRVGSDLIYHNSQMRAPIFYDTDTSYYLNPNGASNLYNLTVGNYSTNQSYPGILITGNTSYNYNFLNGSWSGSITAGFLANCADQWEFAIHDSGTRVVSPFLFDGGGNHRLLMGRDIGWGTMYIEAASSFRAPIFYDTDTSYYLDPDSTSNSALRIRGGALHGPNPTWGAYLLVGGDGRQGYIDNGSTASVCSTNGNLHLDSASGYNTYINWYDGTDLIVGAGDSGTERLRVYGSSNYTQATGSLRSPIFYDTDTSYYVDPNSTSNLNNLLVGGRYVKGKSGDIGTGIYTTGWYTIANYGNGRCEDTLVISDQDSSRHNFVKVNIVWSFGNGGITVVQSGKHGSSTIRHIRLMYNTSNQTYGGVLVQVYCENPSWTLHVHSEGQGAPGWGILNIYGTAVQEDSPSGWAQYSRIDGINDQARLATTGYITSQNEVYAYGSLRSPIFYDNDDTGYYVNPNSVSYLYGLTLAGGSYFRPQNWIQLDASYGLYWPNNNSAHFHANASTTYGQLMMQGNRNGYGGIYDSYSAVNGIMYDGSGNGGVYREGSGRWYFYYNVSNDCMGIGTSNTNSTYSLYLNKGVYAPNRIDATSYYDANDSTYYLDLNGYSQINGNGSTGGSSGVGLNIYSTGGSGAIMAFHRGGHYAVNMGLDSDNVIRIGGWSASSNRWQLDMSGNGTFAGNVTAYSDLRLKDNIETITDALNKVKKIRGITYTRNDQQDKIKRHAGVIAQEVQQVLPEVVSVDNEGILHVAYGNMVGLLIEAVKEQQQQIDKLTKLVEILLAK